MHSTSVQASKIALSLVYNKKSSLLVRLCPNRHRSWSNGLDLSGRSCALARTLLFCLYGQFNINIPVHLLASIRTLFLIAFLLKTYTSCQVSVL